MESPPETSNRESSGRSASIAVIDAAQVVGIWITSGPLWVEAAAVIRVHATLQSRTVTCTSIPGFSNSKLRNRCCTSVKGSGLFGMIQNCKTSFLSESSAAHPKSEKAKRTASMSWKKRISGYTPRSKCQTVEDFFRKAKGKSFPLPQSVFRTGCVRQGSGRSPAHRQAFRSLDAPRPQWSRKSHPAKPASP